MAISQKKKAILLCNSPFNVARVYSPSQMAFLKENYTLLSDSPISGQELSSAAGRWQETEYVFSTWGMPELEEDIIRRELPALQAVFYAAGSVQAFARPFLASGIAVFSAWAANAVPVAEYAASAILLANKGFFSTLPFKANRKGAQEVFTHFAGNYEEKIGLLGLGMVGRETARLLKQYKLDVLYYDPFFPREKEEELGVRPATLEEIFAECSVISNHIANLPSTVGMLNYSLFSRMRPYGFFLNTGRGAQVVEADLARAFREVPTRRALLDVTWPEPPEEGHPFYEMENILLTPHIAGSAGNECFRMAEYMLEEATRLTAGEAPRYRVTEKMLETMA